MEPASPKSTNHYSKWRLIALITSITTIALAIINVCLWKELNNSQAQLTATPDIALVKCPNQAPSDRQSSDDNSNWPAGLTDLDILGLNQAYIDYSKKNFNAVPNFKITVMPQFSSSEQYLKLNKKRTHIIAMFDIVFDKSGVKALFYRPVDGGKWICAVAAHQFPDDSMLSDEAKKVFADDKFWTP